MATNPIVATIIKNGHCINARMVMRVPTAKRSGKVAASIPRSQASRDVIRTLLNVLADHLIEGGVTPQQIADLARDALIARAAADARMATGRVNHSKVAAVTGLSRSEVRRRLADAVGGKRIPLRALDRTSRVIAGWQRDPTFLRRDGKPKELSLSGPGASFASLVRMHSGDIPPRVVLEEMLKKNVVRLEKNKVILLSGVTKTLRRGDDALAEAAPYVAELLAAATLPQSQLGFAHQVQMTAEDASHEILLTEHVVRILSAAIGALESRKAPKKKTANSSRTLRITLTMLSAPSTSSEE